MTARQVLLQRRRSALWRMVAAAVVGLAGVVAISGLHNQFERDHRGWVVELAIVGKSVTLDDRIVTIERSDRSEQTQTMTVLRTSKEGDVIEVWNPPGHPEEVELTRNFFDVRVLMIGWMCGMGGLMLFVTSAFALRRVRAVESLDRSSVPLRPAVVQTWEGGFGGNRKAWMAVYFADVVPMDPRMVVVYPPSFAVCAVFSAASVSKLGVGIRLPVTGVFVARVKTSAGSDMTTLVYNEQSEFLLAGRRVAGQTLPRRPNDPASISLLDLGATRVAPVGGPPPTIVTSRADAWLVIAGYVAIIAFGLLMPIYIANFINFTLSPVIIGSVYALAATAFGLPALVRYRLRTAAKRATADPPAPAAGDYPDNHLRQAASVLGWKWVPARTKIVTAIAAYQLVAIVFILLKIAS